MTGGRAGDREGAPARSRLDQALPIAACLCAAILSSCAAWAPRPAAPVPFSVSSMDDEFFAVLGSYEGHYTVRPKSIVVVVTKAALAFRNQPPPRRERLEWLSVGLGTESDPVNAEWAVEEHSEGHRLQGIMRMGDDLAIPTPIKFTIPKKRRTDLGKRWLVFQVAVTGIEPNGDEGTAGLCYAHSRRNIFRQ